MDTRGNDQDSKKKLYPRLKTHPTIVTPIGHGAFPIERRRYASLAR